MVRGVKQNVRRHSSSAGVNLWVVNAIGLSLVIVWGFGEWMKVIEASGGLATRYSCHDPFPMLSPISRPYSDPITVTSPTPFRSSPI